MSHPCYNIFDVFPQERDPKKYSPDKVDVKLSVLIPQYSLLIKFSAVEKSKHDE